MKIHWHHLQRWGLDLEEILGDVHWIRMRREDRLAQAISWTRALGSGDWVARQDGRTAHVAYSRRAIERRLAAIAAAEAGWSAFFRARSCLEVSYEQLVTEREQSVHRVLDWLGEPRQPVPVPQLRRQSGEASERWRDRFLAGARD